MTKETDNRVLGRRNARDLSAEEVHMMLEKGDRGTLHFTSPFFPDS